MAPLGKVGLSAGVVGFEHFGHSFPLKIQVAFSLRVASKITYWLVVLSILNNPFENIVKIIYIHRLKWIVI